VLLELRGFSPLTSGGVVGLRVYLGRRKRTASLRSTAQRTEHPHNVCLKTLEVAHRGGCTVEARDKDLVKQYAKCHTLFLGWHVQARV